MAERVAPGPANQASNEFQAIMQARRVAIEGSNGLDVPEAGAHTAPVPLRRSLPKTMGPPGTQREHAPPPRMSGPGSQYGAMLMPPDPPARQVTQQPLPRQQVQQMQVQQQLQQQPQQQQQQHQQMPRQQHPLASSMRILPPRANSSIQISGSASPAEKLGHHQATSPQGGRSMELSFPRQVSKEYAGVVDDRPPKSDKVVPPVQLPNRAPVNSRHTIAGPHIVSHQASSREASSGQALYSARGGRVSCGALYEEIAQLKNQARDCSRLWEENKAQQREIAELKRIRDQDKSSYLQALAERNAVVNYDSEALRVKLDGLRLQSDAYQRELQEMKLNREQAEYDKQCLQEENEQLRRAQEEVRSKQDELEDMKHTTSVQSIEYNKITCELEEVMSQVQKLMGEKDHLVKQVDRLTSALEHRSEEESGLKNKIADLEQQLGAERRRLSDQRRLSEEQGRLWAAQSAGAGAGTGEAATLQPSPTAAACSESRLRAAMTAQCASPERLKQAIVGVEALLGEARRELKSKQLRERRAAFEQLHAALEASNEDELAKALEFARRAEVEDEDLAKAEAKLLGLRSQTQEERATKAAKELESERKKEAFHHVKKDDAVALRRLFDGFEEGVRWQDWRDYMGRNMWRFALEMRATHVQDFLRPLLGMDAPGASPRPSTSTCQVDDRAPAMSSQSLSGQLLPASVAAPASDKWCPNDSGSEATLPPPEADLTTEEEAVQELPLPSEEQQAEMKKDAFRFVVQDNLAGLGEVLDRLPRAVWSKWENKAGKDLITLSQERGSSGAYSVLAKRLGLVQDRKKESYEEREAVWIFLPGEVQPLRATVLEDTPEELDDVLIEYWDGDAPPCRIEKCMVRKMWS